jgi:hypothetical protein
MGQQEARWAAPSAAEPPEDRVALVELEVAAQVALVALLAPAGAWEGPMVRSAAVGAVFFVSALSQRPVAKR